jgi:hypothetical protein
MSCDSRRKENKTEKIWIGGRIRRNKSGRAEEETAVTREIQRKIKRNQKRRLGQEEANVLGFLPF